MGTGLEDLPTKRRRGKKKRMMIRSFWTQYQYDRVDGEGGAMFGKLVWEMYSAKPCEVEKAKGLERDKNISLMRKKDEGERRHEEGGTR